MRRINANYIFILITGTYVNNPLTMTLQLFQAKPTNSLIC